MTSAYQAIAQLQAYVEQHIIGQQELVNRLMIAILADGHLLVEGAPGLAKTKAIHLLSQGIEGDYQRIQFTPDLLPADLTGTEIFRPKESSFHFQPGPLFHNIVLADEINRAPAKVQSALLEAMAERQVTVASVSYPLPELFLVMATQNPLEQEGTYPLPEAQLDRFLMKVKVAYPDAKAERQILALSRKEAAQGVNLTEQVTLKQEDIFSARQEVLNVYMSESLEEYLIQLIMSTRNPSPYGEDLKTWLEYGASPRATIALDRCARAHAWLDGRDYVTPLDIQSLAYDVLRHRLILSYEAEAEGIDPDTWIGQLITRIPIP